MRVRKDRLVQLVLMALMVTRVDQDRLELLTRGSIRLVARDPRAALVPVAATALGEAVASTAILEVREGRGSMAASVRRAMQELPEVLGPLVPLVVLVGQVGRE